MAGDSFLVSLFILGFVFLGSCATGISALGFFVCELLAGDDSGLAEDAASLKKKLMFSKKERLQIISTYKCTLLMDASLFQLRSDLKLWEVCYWLLGVLVMASLF